MAYDNLTKDCKFANLCSSSVRCGASEENPISCYRKDERTLLQKIFSGKRYNDEVKSEYNRMCQNEKNFWSKRGRG